jgi:hypothetical protein
MPETKSALAPSPPLDINTEALSQIAALRQSLSEMKSQTAAKEAEWFDRYHRTFDSTLSSYGLAVALLGGFLAFLAIGVTFALFRQSREYQQAAKRQVTSFLESWKKVFEGVHSRSLATLEAGQKQVAELEVKINAIPSEGSPAVAAALEEAKKALGEVKKFGTFTFEGSLFRALNEQAGWAEPKSRILQCPDCGQIIGKKTTINNVGWGRCEKCDKEISGELK